MTTGLVRAFRHGDFDARALVGAKRGRTVSVCLPARNEAATVGTIVGLIRRELIASIPLVDDLLVVDDHSTDATAEVAAAAGARVVSTADLLPEMGPGGGKGEALWKSVHASTGDVIAWCDADVTNFGAHFVVGLVGPLLVDPQLTFVKAFYERPHDGRPGEGGRVTELVARPLLSLLYPQLAGVLQPLGGEYAGRRDVLEQLPFVEGYGVDLGLLIDVAARFGTQTIAQVDLGARVHRNRPLAELSPQALAVLHTGLRRAGVAPAELRARLLRPGLEPVSIGVDERPPLVQVPGYRRRTA